VSCPPTEIPPDGPTASIAPTAPNKAKVPSVVARSLFLVGPTAVGKTELSLRLAEALGGEIINLDAFQVYRGLDLLTAKPDADALARVPHHLVGTVPLATAYSVARYREEALEAALAIDRRGRVPIFSGGTGLYLRALTRGLGDAPPGNPALRQELASQPLAALLARLDTLDPESGRTIDRQNPRRVLRALEVTLLSGRPFSSFRQEWEAAPVPFCGFLLERPREELHARIARRTEAMFAQGVVEEVAQALAGDASGPMGETASQVLGLAEIKAHLEGKITRHEAIDAITRATRQYAKRQLTWFRREPMLKHVPIATDGTDAAFTVIIQAFRASLS